MRKFILVALLLTTSALWAMGPDEEALLLNQELQFLEEAANKSIVLPSTTPAASGFSNNTAENTNQNEVGLEDLYFKDGSTDTVTSRTAAPRRRRGTD